MLLSLPPLTGGGGGPNDLTATRVRKMHQPGGIPCLTRAGLPRPGGRAYVLASSPATSHLLVLALVALGTALHPAITPVAPPNAASLLSASIPILDEIFSILPSHSVGFLLLQGRS